MSGMGSRSRHIGLETQQNMTSLSPEADVSVSSRLFTSRAQDVIFNQIMQATLIKWAKSVVAIDGSINPRCKLTLCVCIMYYDYY